MLHGKQIRTTDKTGKQVTFSTTCTDNVEVNVKDVTMHFSAEQLRHILILLSNDEVRK